MAQFILLNIVVAVLMAQLEETQAYQRDEQGFDFEPTPQTNAETPMSGDDRPMEELDLNKDADSKISMGPDPVLELATPT